VAKNEVIGTPLQIRKGLSGRLSEGDLTVKEADLIKRLTIWQRQSSRRDFFIGSKQKKAAYSAKS